MRALMHPMHEECPSPWRVALSMFLRNSRRQFSPSFSRNKTTKLIGSFLSAILRLFTTSISSSSYDVIWRTNNCKQNKLFNSLSANLMGNLAKRLRKQSSQRRWYSLFTWNNELRVLQKLYKVYPWEIYRKPPMLLFVCKIAILWSAKWRCKRYRSITKHRLDYLVAEEIIHNSSVTQLAWYPVNDNPVNYETRFVYPASVIDKIIEWFYGKLQTVTNVNNN